MDNLAQDEELEEDFDLKEISEEEPELEFDSEEIEDYRDINGKKIKFQNDILGGIDLTDEHHTIMYIIPDDERISSHIMTLDEMTEAVGSRASEIEKGSPVFTDVEGFTCPIKQAKKELLDRRSPYKLMRIMRQDKEGKYVEFWDVNEMTLPRSRQEIIMLTNKQMAAQLGIDAPQIPLKEKKVLKRPAKKKPTASTIKPKPKAPVKKKPAKKK
jgi:DNA-directed RNA polymerase subunit K/omega